MDARDRLTQIALEIRSMGTAAGECEHLDADKLLVAALECLATDQTRPMIEDVILAYNAMNKWYA